MIYETIPRKYILLNPQQEFKKLVNSNKYSPEAHYCEFIWMLHYWLNWSGDGILDCKNSEGARLMGHNMKTLNEVKDAIYEAIDNHFDEDDEKYQKWIDEHKSQELHDERNHVLRGYLTSENLAIYLKSSNLNKIFDKFGIEFEVDITED